MVYVAMLKCEDLSQPKLHQQAALVALVGLEDGGNNCHVLRPGTPHDATRKNNGRTPQAAAHSPAPTTPVLQRSPLLAEYSMYAIYAHIDLPNRPW